MSTKPVDKDQRAINKRLKKPVTRGELATLLSDWAKAADASLTVKMETMREELRAELHGPFVVASEEQLTKFSLQDRPESAPTTAEGEE
jgi:predicted ATP-grasp superfamily ATP-dependent carboligase